jgi:uncharacterized protein YqhQ
LGEPAPDAPPHLYGGQAVMEGVMMRGAAFWAVAVRRPDGSMHLESHEVGSIDRHRFFSKPLLRGILVLGQSVSIGLRALQIAGRVALGEEAEELPTGTMGAAIALAVVVFLVVFVAGPALLFGWIGHHVGHGLLVNVGEGIFRVALFVGYLILIGQIKEIRRVFQYHGAEHKTIAAFEHGEPLEPASVDRYSTLHVRCGTNFLLIVMLVTVFVAALFGSPDLWWRIGSRILIVPVVAAVSYELLRLGARFAGSPLMAALMAPGLWLQRITTKQPDQPQIEVAIASFQEVRRREAESSLPVTGDNSQGQGA